MEQASAMPVYAEQEIAEKLARSRRLAHALKTGSISLDQMTIEVKRREVDALNTSLDRAADGTGR